MHVGDTPFDVIAAKHAGFEAIGILQGKFKADDLTKEVPETVIIDDWKDLDSALHKLGLS